MENNPDLLYDEAIRMLASGHDNTYIELQFLEEGIPKETISSAISRINKVRKAEKRMKARKMILYGLSTVAAGVIFSLISFSENSPIHYVLYGVCISGVLLLAKGVVDMI